MLGHDHDAGAHAAHELGSFDLALAIAFAVGAIRPALSAGLAWPCGIAAAGLVGTAVVDLVGGQTIGADEAQHLIALAGAALLFWQARTVRAGIAGPAIADGHAQPTRGRPPGRSPPTCWKGRRIRRAAEPAPPASPRRAAPRAGRLSRPRARDRTAAATVSRDSMSQARPGLPRTVPASRAGRR